MISRHVSTTPTHAGTRPCNFKKVQKVPGAGGTKVNLGTSKKKIEFPMVIVILRVSLSPSPVKYQKFLTCGR